MTRDLSGKTKPPLPPSPAPVSTTATIETSNGSASTSSLALSTPVASVGAIQTLVDNAADEGLVILQSPRVRNKLLKCFYFCWHTVNYLPAH